MTKIKNSLELAQLQFSEIRSSIKIWGSYKNILVKYSGPIQGQIHDPATKAELVSVLKEKSVSSDLFHRSLVIQVYSVFEFYIKTVANEIIDYLCNGKESYSALNSGFRDTHLVLTAKVLSHLKSGSVNGIPHSFEMTTNNLKGCLLDTGRFFLNKDAYTLLMGNCTPDRIDNLFLNLDLSPPFNDKTSHIGKNTGIQRFFNSTKSAENVKAASSKLKSMINKRNEMVHGNLTTSVSLTELEESLGFTESLSSAINEHICNVLPA